MGALHHQLRPGSLSRRAPVQETPNPYEAESRGRLLSCSGAHPTMSSRVSAPVCKVSIALYLPLSIVCESIYYLLPIALLGKLNFSEFL